MSRTVTVGLPDEVYGRVQEAARAEGIRVEDALQRSLRSFWLAGVPGDTGLESATERRALAAAGIESTDWWDTPEDREWEQWQPLAPVT